MTVNADQNKVLAALGMVAEKVAADTDLCAAVKLLLGFEQDHVDVGFRQGVPSDVAYPDVANRLGQIEGLRIAIDTLTDAETIASRRENIEARIKIKEAKRDR